MAPTAAEQTLPSPYNTPPAAGALRPTAATTDLVKTQVHALLMSSSAYHALPPDEQRKLGENLVKVAAYCAELIRDDWCQSVQRLDQQPVVRRTEVAEGPMVARAQAAGDDFKPAAASQIARVTKETLRAIAFPTFVADLIKGTFNAITQSSIQQMEAYQKLLDNVGKSVDQFQDDNITDIQAAGWLQQAYPDHIITEGGKAMPHPSADERPLPNFKRDLNLGSDVSLDESSIEEKLVPAARRKLAQTRLQLLSTMVLMGMNRIVVTGGKIRATMGFHIDTRDRAHAEEATDLDARVAASGSFGFGPWSASLSTSVTYVSSTRKDSDSELNVESDLTGEVEIHFKTEHFPINRMADSSAIGRIQANTPVPENNPAPPGPFNEPPSVGGEVGAFKSSRTKRSEKREPSLPKIGTPLPEAKLPVKPTKPEVERHVDMDWSAEEEWKKFGKKKDGEKKEGEKKEGEKGEAADKSGEGAKNGKGDAAKKKATDGKGDAAKKPDAAKKEGGEKKDAEEKDAETGEEVAEHAEG
jgi:hypothetical protein